MHVDIGGEGRYARAFNVNPQLYASTTGDPGRAIPNRLFGTADDIPLPTGIAELVTVENAPLCPGATEEIRRILKPGGAITLLHPTSYAVGSGMHDAMAGALGAELAERTSFQLARGQTLTVLRTAADLLR